MVGGGFERGGSHCERRRDPRFAQAALALLVRTVVRTDSL